MRDLDVLMRSGAAGVASPRESVSPSLAAAAPLLLVSVRDAAEATEALHGGADVLDIKEPARGSLGMADPQVIAEVARCAAAQGPSIPLSAALGETRDWLGAAQIPALPPELGYVKLGLSGMAARSDWVSDWLLVRRRFEQAAGRALRWIGVAYADDLCAGSPTVEEIMRTAAATGCRGVLIDTWSKQGPGLTGCAGDDQIREWIGLARWHGLLVALAGRLSAHDIGKLASHGADILGVRSAACEGQNRRGPLSAARVDALQRVLQRAANGDDRRVAEAAEFIRKHWPRPPVAGIILGTGLARFEDAIETELRLGYEEIPHFAPSTAEGHSGRLVCGTVDGLPVIALAGRWHLYEGYSREQITLPVRMLHRLGIKRLIVSNAAGGLNPRLAVGDLVLIDDHLDLTFSRPRAASGPVLRRNFDPGGAYDREMIAVAEAIACGEGIRAQRGTYAAVTGPNYETRAEYRMYRELGADVIGMSTVPEVTVAAELELRVLAISTVTNVCNPDALAGTDGSSVAAAAAAAEWKLRRIVLAVLRSHAEQFCR